MIFHDRSFHDRFFANMLISKMNCNNIIVVLAAISAVLVFAAMYNIISKKNQHVDMKIYLKKIFNW